MSLILDGTAGLTFNNATTQNSGGKVLQVVNATYGTQVSSTTSTYVDTGLTATITPLFTTSKILVTVFVNGIVKTTNATYLKLKIVRGSTDILVYESVAASTGAGTDNAVGTSGAEYADSPATTSATTYKVQFASGGNLATAYVQYNAGGGNIATSTITLMEIAV
jgi:hypothetical protein